MALTSLITSYDPRWPKLFEQEASQLRPIFGNTCINIHHVGSTAVRGLAAKPEIDILLVVSNVSHLDQWQGNLFSRGYRRGKDLMKDHHFFKRDVNKIRTHKLHICLSGHPQISRMLGIRDHLRGNATDRATYAALKRRLESENRTGIAAYLAGKAPYLDDLFCKIQDPAY